jgi:hypothetical protein
VKKTPPTKEQVKAARAQMRAASKIITAGYMAKHKRRSRFVRRPSVDRDFYTWQHDFQTVLESTAKELGTPSRSSVDRAAQAADRMREIIEARRPAEIGPAVYRYLTGEYDPSLVSEQNHQARMNRRKERS